MKEKLLWAGIVLAVISWIGNYTYFQSKQLDRPIFLDHYYDLSIGEEGSLTFYYLANKKDQSDVTSVAIGGVEVMPVHYGGFVYSDQGPQYEQEFVHQYLRSVTVEIPRHAFDVTNLEENELNAESIDVMFSDGRMMTADIGRVRLDFSPHEPSVLEGRMSGSSNQHRDISSLVATEALTIEGISHPFREELADDIAIKLDVDQKKLKKLEEVRNSGEPPQWHDAFLDEEWNEVAGVDVKKDIFPIALGKGEWMQLVIQFNPERTSYFRFDIEVTGTTEAGEPFIGRAPIIDPPFLEQEDITSIIATKQGGGSE